jgi:hypothetical protein
MKDSKDSSIDEQHTEDSDEDMVTLEIDSSTHQRLRRTKPDAMTFDEFITAALDESSADDIPGSAE